MTAEIINNKKPDPIEPKLGFLIPQDWEEQLIGSMTPEEIVLEEVYYISFDRRALLEDGINYFYTNDGGKNWRRANGLFCRTLYKTREKALAHLRKLRDEHLEDLEEEVNKGETAKKRIEQLKPE